MAFRRPKHIGTFLLAIWLIVYGALVLLDVASPVLHNLNAALAVAAGIVIFLQK